MIYLKLEVSGERVNIVRKAVCERCGHEWTAHPEFEYQRCPGCNAAQWQWGRDSKVSRWIRHGRTNKTSRVISRGVRSEKQQAWAKWWASQQYHQFKPKPGEPPIYIGKQKRKRDT